MRTQSMATTKSTIEQQPTLASRMLSIFRDLACGTIFMFESIAMPFALKLIKVGANEAYELKTKKSYKEGQMCVAQLITKIDEFEPVIVPGVEII